MTTEFQLVLFIVFVTFFVLTGLACLGVMLGKVKDADPRFRRWAIPGFFAGLIAAVLGAWQVSFLSTVLPTIQVSLAPVTESGAPETPSLIGGTYEYDSQDSGRVVTRSGPIQVALGNGGWEAYMPGEVGQSAVILRFTDESNQTWRTSRFFPNHINAKVMLGVIPPARANDVSALPGVAVVSAAELSQVNRGTKFNNYARRIADQYARATWEWRVFVDEPPEVLQTISQVEYVLHPTFPNPIQTSSDRQHQFGITASGWGTFNILITVRYTDGREAKTSYYLSFQKSWPAARS